MNWGPLWTRQMQKIKSRQMMWKDLGNAGGKDGEEDGGGKD